MKPMRQHPAEAYQDQLIARAVRFEICLFLGVGQYARADAPDLQAAEDQAKRLEAENPNGRRALIYAITADQRPALIIDPTRKWRTKMEMQAQARAEDKAAAKRAANAERMRKHRAKIKAMADAKLAADPSREPAKLPPAGSIMGALIGAQIKAGRSIAPPAGANGEGVASVQAIEAPAKPARKSRRADAAAMLAGKSIEAIAQAAEAQLGAPAGAAAEALAILQAGCPPIPPAADAPPKGKRAEAAAKLLADAQAGILPPIPDMTAKTHAYYKRHLDRIIALAEAGDLAGLKADKIEPLSGSRKLICKYRDHAIIALEARAAK